jgi:hypothetical protein
LREAQDHLTLTPLLMSFMHSPSFLSLLLLTFFSYLPGQHIYMHVRERERERALEIERESSRLRERERVVGIYIYIKY